MGIKRCLDCIYLLQKFVYIHVMFATLWTSGQVTKTKEKYFNWNRTKHRCHILTKLVLQQNLLKHLMNIFFMNWNQKLWVNWKWSSRTKPANKLTIHGVAKPTNTDLAIVRVEDATSDKILISKCIRKELRKQIRAKQNANSMLYCTPRVSKPQLAKYDFLWGHSIWQQLAGSGINLLFSKKTFGHCWRGRFVGISGAVPPLARFRSQMWRCK